MGDKSIPKKYPQSIFFMNIGPWTLLEYEKKFPKTSYHLRDWKRRPNTIIDYHHWKFRFRLSPWKKETRYFCSEFLSKCLIKDADIINIYNISFIMLLAIPWFWISRFYFSRYIHFLKRELPCSSIPGKIFLSSYS